MHKKDNKVFPLNKVEELGFHDHKWYTFWFHLNWRYIKPRPKKYSSEVLMELVYPEK